MALKYNLVHCLNLLLAVITLPSWMYPYKFLSAVESHESQSQPCDYVSLSSRGTPCPHVFLDLTQVSSLSVPIPQLLPIFFTTAFINPWPLLYWRERILLVGIFTFVRFNFWEFTICRLLRVFNFILFKNSFLNSNEPPATSHGSLEDMGYLPSWELRKYRQVKVCRKFSCYALHWIHVFSADLTCSKGVRL